MDTTGFVGVAGGAPTDTVTVCESVPPAPSQVSVKLRSDVSAAVVSLPEVALLPDQPPEAVQEVESVDDQLSVVVPL